MTEIMNIQLIREFLCQARTTTWILMREPPGSIKPKEAMDVLDRCLTWLLSLRLLQRTLSLHEHAAHPHYRFSSYQQTTLLTYSHNKYT